MTITAAPGSAATCDIGSTLDAEACYRAVSGRDVRFDGRFIVGVRSTGIYCRPSCPARTPLRRNTEFFRSAAAAQTSGYRACRRCLPDAVPGSPEWNLRADLAGRAMRLINDGEVERAGVPGLATRLGYSERQLHRVLLEELGAGPLALARANRAHTAQLLLQATSLPFSEIAFAAGFSSIRQFNASIQQTYACTPATLRAAGTATVPGHAAVDIELKLAFRDPLHTAGLLDFLRDRAVAGLESCSPTGFRRAMRLPYGTALMELTTTGSQLRARLRLTELRDLRSAVNRLRRLLDLDADPTAVDQALSQDPVLAPLVAKRPGLRLPGSLDPAETLLRIMVGQQISVPAARTHLARMVARLGEPLPNALCGPDGAGADLRTFPTPAIMAEHAAEVLAGPKRRRESIREVSARLAAGEVPLHYGSEPAQLREQLLSLPGVGQWTADLVLMRVLGEPDVLATGDLVLRGQAGALGLGSTVPALRERARRWRPWRSYAAAHIWAAARNATSAESATTRALPGKDGTP